MNISKKILLISNKKTNFLSTTIYSYFQEKNFDVLLSGFNVDEIEKMSNRPSLILLTFENIDETDKSFLCYIRDLCMKEETWVYLCGEDNEIKFVSSVLPKNAIVDTCSRPFDIPDMINKMIKDIDKYEQNKEKENISKTHNSVEPEREVSKMTKILLLSNKKSSFLSTTIKTRLQQENYDVIVLGFDVDEVSKMKINSSLILMNFENIDEEDKQFLFYIRDLCIEEEQRVYLCGHENEINYVATVLPKGTVMGTFKRPFNIPDLISKINKEVDKYKRDGAKKHILVVDDSGEMLQSVRSWLSDTYRVSIVNSGANAILFLANQKPDLILLDYEMPFCSGPQMMEMIRAENSTCTIPIMFLTGKNDAESLKKVLSLKPEGYILKTTKPEKIKEIIGKFFVDQKAKEYNKEL